MTGVIDPNLLASAAFHGDLKQIDALLRAGADINAEGDNWNPLHAAVENGNAEAVRFLLSRGADVERSALGWTPLAHALDLELDIASNNAPLRPPVPEISPILIEFGANPNAVVPNRGTLLQWLGRDYPSATKMLIDAGGRP